MANITFTEGSGLQDSIYGKSQAPIRMFLEKRGEAFEQQSIVKEIFNMEKSSNWAEKLVTMGSMEGFKPVGENGAYPVDGFQEGHSRTLEHMTWKDSFSLSREMIDDAKLMDLKKKPNAFITAYHRTREKFGAALLGGAISGEAAIKMNGFSFSTNGADNVSLFNTAHPAADAKNKKVQTNKFSDAFSNDALMAIEEKMQNFTDDAGNILDVVPDTIILPNDYKLKKDVFAAIGADKDPATANNGFNYTYGRWNVIIWPYLNQFIKAGTSPWLVMASAYNKEYAGAVWFDRVALEVKSEIDSGTDANVWRGYSRFTAGFNDWRAFAVGGAAGGTALIG